MDWAGVSIAYYLWKSESNDSCFQLLLKQLIDVSNRDALYLMGLCYQCGRGVEKNLDNALDYYRMASKKSLMDAKYAVFDLLWDRGDERRYPEMIAAIEVDSKLGDSESILRLAKSYRYGRGVKKDVYKAIDLYKSLSNLKISRADAELFDMLWELNDPHIDEELLGIVEKYNLAANPWMKARYAKMLEYGRGVDINIPVAEQLLREVISKVKWARMQLIILLLDKDTETSVLEAMALLDEECDNRSPDAFGLMGTLLISNKWVVPDLERGLDYLRKASVKQKWKRI